MCMSRGGGALFYGPLKRAGGSLSSGLRGLDDDVCLELGWKVGESIGVLIRVF